MKYLTIILSLLDGLKEIVSSFLKKRQEKKRIEERKKVDDFKVETEKNVINGEVDDINSKLKF